MIELSGLTKLYDGFTAVDGADLSIPDQEVYAIVGTNGAGKSTLMRMIAGIIRPTGGYVTIDGKTTYEDPSVKRRFFYISDDQYIPRSFGADELYSFYEGFYPAFDRKKAARLIDTFALPSKRKTGSFSKGMKKLLFVALAVASGTEYILADETFDGIDPLMRAVVKDLIKEEMAARPLTAVINSHHFDELTDFILDVSLMHKGRIVYRGPIEGIYESDIFSLIKG